MNITHHSWFARPAGLLVWVFVAIGPTLPAQPVYPPDFRYTWVSTDGNPNHMSAEIWLPAISGSITSDPPYFSFFLDKSMTDPRGTFGDSYTWGYVDWTPDTITSMYLTDGYLVFKDDTIVETIGGPLAPTPYIDSGYWLGPGIPENTSTVVMLGSATGLLWILAFKPGRHFFAHKRVDA